MASLGSSLGITPYVICCICVIPFLQQPGKKTRRLSPKLPLATKLLSNSGSINIWSILDGLHLLSCKKFAQAVSSLL